MDIGTLTIEYWVNKWQGGHCFGENNGAKYIFLRKRLPQWRLDIPENACGAAALWAMQCYYFKKELILGRRHICYLMCVLHLELHVQGVH